MKPHINRIAMQIATMKKLNILMVRIIKSLYSSGFTQPCKIAKPLLMNWRFKESF